MQYESDHFLPWTTTQVCDWLGEVGMESYCTVFQSKSILGSDLPTLTAARLESYGIPRMARLRIIGNIKALRFPKLERKETSVVALLLAKRSIAKWTAMRKQRKEKRELLREKARTAGHDVESDPNFSHDRMRRRSLMAFGPSMFQITEMCWDFCKRNE